jgi:hypothetical protein
MKKINLGKISIPVSDYASQGNAILGIRDSGKSYTATAIAEQMMDAGIPIIAFDPIGIWRYLRVPGAGKGYEVIVAGGKQGDLPLTAQGAQEIVRAAIRANVSLVIDLYDMNLSKADWRKIVGSCIRTLLYENGEHGPRHIFIEEASEFCPQVVSSDQGTVYAEVEKLARMGGNAGLGYTLINQRAEQVNKAVLELCDCMMLHRQKGKNSINSLSKWLDVATADKGHDLIKSLPGLAQGECWVWPAGADAATRTRIPAKRSLHPDRRMKQAAATNDIKVDVSVFVENMKASLAAMTKDAEANDPKKLRTRIAELEKRIRILEQENAGLNAALQGDGPMAGAEPEVVISDQSKELLATLQKVFKIVAPHCQVVVSGKPEGPTLDITLGRGPKAIVRHVAVPAAKMTGKPEQRVLNALAWWDKVHPGTFFFTKVQVGHIAGYSPKSGNFGNILGKLKAQGLIDYPQAGYVSLTTDGSRVADPVEAPTTEAELRQMVYAGLNGPQRAVLEAVLADKGDGLVSKQAIAAATGYSANSGNFGNILGKLRSFELIDYPRPGYVKAADFLYLSR